LGILRLYYILKINIVFVIYLQKKTHNKIVCLVILYV